MAYYIVTDSELGAIADAIREKGGTSGELMFPGNFVEAIQTMTLPPAESEEAEIPVPEPDCTNITAAALSASGPTSSSGPARTSSATITLDPDYVYVFDFTRYTKSNPTSGTITLTATITTYKAVYLYDGTQWRALVNSTPPNWFTRTLSGNDLTIGITAAYSYYVKSSGLRVAKIRNLTET